MAKLSKKEESQLEKAYKIYQEESQKNAVLVDRIAQLKTVHEMSTYPDEVNRKIRLVKKCAQYLQAKVSGYNRAMWEPPEVYSSPITIGGLPEKQALKKQARDEKRAKKEMERGGLAPVHEWDEGKTRLELAEQGKEEGRRLWRIEQRKIAAEAELTAKEAAQ